MKLKLVTRLVLALVMAFLGFVLSQNIFSDIFFTGSLILGVLGAAALGLLGFILPEILELAGKAGIAAFANQVASHLKPGLNVVSKPKLSFRVKKTSKYPNPLILDTSALIDGRVLDVARAGFLFGNLLVIPSVIGELHKLADSFDEVKRAKGRRGLDCLSNLQTLGKNRQSGFSVEILNSEPDGAGVDEKLVKIAKKLKAKIVSVDFNMAKVARVKGVKVLNLNELANAVKTAVLPQERLKVQVKTVGRERNQGVGYLVDGTMVVVEGGAKMKGKTLDVIVKKVIQTEAGKMIFAKPALHPES